MLNRAGHGFLLVVNARSLAKEYLGDLGQVPESRFKDWQGLGFGAVLLLQSWVEPADGQARCVHAFATDDGVGGIQGLEIFRRRASEYGLGVLLDFPPFQVAQFNPLLDIRDDWVIHRPNVSEGEWDPEAWFAKEVEAGQVLAFARGKDPYFPPVPGSAQLNPFHPVLREQMQSVLARMATLCDGAWFSSAMLALPVAVEKTWGDFKNPVAGGSILEDSPWPLLLESARDLAPEFLGLAEGYWGVEWDLMGQGFNFCLDQRLTQRLAGKDWTGLMAHLSAPREFLSRTLHRWHELRQSLDGQDRHLASLVWSLFLATPGLKLVEEHDLDWLMESCKGLDGNGTPNPFYSAWNAASILDAEWIFRLIEFPGNRMGFDGEHLGFLWSLQANGESQGRHLLFLSRLTDGEDSELELQVGSAVCQSIKRSPPGISLSANSGGWQGDHYQVVLKGRSPVFFEIRPNMKG